MRLQNRFSALVIRALCTCTLLIFWFGRLEVGYALPIFAENAAVKSGTALTLYPDSQDANKFYFMPNSSRIARDARGIPTFSFTYYGLSDPHAEAAGALMVYVGRLASDESQIKAIDDFLFMHPQSKIAVLPIRESTISLGAPGSARPLKKFFEEFNFSMKGGRAEDEIGVNAVLTRIGAKVLKASLLSEAGAALKYDSCYKVEGLGPTLDAEISIEMNRVYDHFKLSGSAGAIWWRASVEAEVEKLVKNHAIRWRITGGDANDEEYVREATNKIIERMFKPELALSSAGTATVWETATPLSFGGNYSRKTERAVESWNLHRQSIETLEFCVPLVLKDIQSYKKQCVINADAQKFVAPYWFSNLNFDGPSSVLEIN